MRAGSLLLKNGLAWILLAAVLFLPSLGEAGGSREVGPKKVFDQGHASRIALAALAKSEFKNSHSIVKIKWMEPSEEDENGYYMALLMPRKPSAPQIGLASSKPQEVRYIRVEVDGTYSFEKEEIRQIRSIQEIYKEAAERAEKKREAKGK